MGIPHGIICVLSITFTSTVFAGINPNIFVCKLYFSLIKCPLLLLDLEDASTLSALILKDTGKCKLIFASSVEYTFISSGILSFKYLYEYIPVKKIPNINNPINVFL